MTNPAIPDIHDDGADIAIIGMAGRFPGANTVDAFWHNLHDGVESITHFSDAELLEAGIDPALLNDPSYVKAGAVLRNIDHFDASFFGLTPTEAKIMDPQQRLFLEAAWNALESAGYDPETYKGPIGIYGGSGLSTYLLNNIYPNEELMETLGPVQIVLGNDKDSLVTRVAYLLNLTGPAYSVQTYCSTSLVAVSIACSSLLNGDCDMALAGGVAISVPQNAGYTYQEGGISSPDARCRAFDAQANGAPLGSGVGVVVLKRLEDARADGDTIHAVIKGSAINNDGSLKVGFTAPGVRGQTGVILEALANADVQAEGIDYLEAHGTGTPLGDAVELTAITRAFREHTDKKQFCALGSAKTNVGHLDRAAGVTGLIKTVLSLKHKQIPPSLNYTEPNPQVDIANSPFYVNTTLAEWKSHGRPRRAGVSAFGLGGTNAHVIVEEAPAVSIAPPSRSQQLLLLSAKTASALEQATDNLYQHIKQTPEMEMADVAYTLQVGRKAFSHRRLLVCTDREDALARLDTRNAVLLPSGTPAMLDRPVAFLFAGVGEQYVSMSRELYEREPHFRAVVDQCCELALPWLGLDLRTLLFPPINPSNEQNTGLDMRALLGRNGTSTLTASQDEQHLQQTHYAQPAIFIIQYSLAQLLLSWSVQPQALLGYSLGEYVAAAVSGVFSLSDALQLVCHRAQLIASLPTSSMLAVALNPEMVKSYLTSEIDLAIINSPQQCVLAGPTQAIEQLETHLNTLQISCRRLQTSHAFHSHLLEPIRSELCALVASFQLHAPTIPYISNVSGNWISDDEALDPQYWGRHLCETVHFGQGVQRLYEQGNPVLLELGPGHSLASFAHQQMATRITAEQPLTVISALRGRFEDRSDLALALEALGKLWIAGVNLDWSQFWQQEQRRRVPLPTYPFERQRHWVDAPRVSRVSSSQQPVSTSKYQDPADWFYLPTWSERPLVAARSSNQGAGPWLLLQDETGIVEQLAQHLEYQGEQVIRVHMGASFEQIDSRTYRLPAGQRDAFEALGRSLQSQGQRPVKLVHGWSLDPSHPGTLTVQEIQASQQRGLYSLLGLLQGLQTVIDDQTVQVIVLTNQTQAVTGSEVLHPEHATLAAIGKVLVQEQLNCTARVIDGQFTTKADTASSEIDWLEQLYAELRAPISAPIVAYRAGRRYEQDFVPRQLPLPSGSDKLRQRGVYLITGGLGGVGMLLAEHLARTLQARLVLLSRTGLPERTAWLQWLDEHPETERTSQQIRRVLLLEALGAEVLVLKADVGDVEQVKQAIAQTSASVGALHGVIHAAGYTSRDAFATIQETGPQLCEKHFQPKVYALLALEEALKGQDLDFCLLFSSLSSILGGLGFAAYTSANAFIDAYTYDHNRRSQTPWLSVDWDTWQLTDVIEQGSAMGGSVALYAMSPAEGIDAFTRVLHTTGLPQIVHSTGSLQMRIQQWIRLESSTFDDQSAPPITKELDLTLLTHDDYEQRIIEIWQQVLGVPHVGLHDNFFDLGGNSLMGLQLLSRIKKLFQVQIPAVALFEAPTVSALAQYLRPKKPIVPTPQEDLLAQRRQQARQQVNTDGVAIIGMAGRFPGAASIEQFWQNLRNGVESITFFSEEELIETGVDPQLLQLPNFVKARPIIQGVEDFDATFFGYSPREAELMDPQHKIFLESCWEALENAGYDSLSYEGLIGVFAGNNISTYMLGLVRHPELVGNVNDYQMVIGNDKDSLTTTVSYKLNLKGPSFAVQTFCSTSLVATHLACRSLLNGECDLMLAGGVSVRVPYKAGHIYQEGGQESPDGHCRTFDAQAQGSMFGDGVGIVVLKRLSDALSDGDTIHAVIKGSAINNDGSLKVSYTAPSVVGQAQVVSTALQVAGVSPDSISYIEAHGTATELGDPIEVASLTRAFRQQTEQVGYCAIGSVKTNIGHLDRAAGVSGLLKTVLALTHEELPPSLHYQSPNPEIDFASSPFFVNAQLRPWPRTTTPRRAGINSLGMGGTNVHVVVEEAPLQEPSSPSRPWHLLPLSARTPEALQQARENLQAFLQNSGSLDLADVASTLQRGRRRFEHRSILLARSQEEAIHLLQIPGADGKRQWSSQGEEQERPVVWLFAGVGEQYVGMGRDLYEQEAHFRQIVDQCCDLATPWLGLDLRTLLFPSHTPESTSSEGVDLRALLGRTGTPAEPQSEQTLLLARTDYAQPAVFIIEYALAQLLLSWGVRPAGLLGYSLGEYVAATVAGVLSLVDGLQLVCHRAQLIARLPESSMLAVALGAEGVQPYLSEQIDLAILNSCQQSVLAGPCEAIEELEQQLHSQQISVRRLQTSHAFHSQQLEPIRAQLIDLVQNVQLHAPQIPYLSNVTGDWMTQEQALDPQYWGRHLCEPVQFAQSIEQLWKQGEPVFLEVGPGHSLASFVHQQTVTMQGQSTAVTVPCLRARLERAGDVEVALGALARLWVAGVKLEWEQFWSGERRRRLPLPTYPFQRQRYWLDANYPTTVTPVKAAPASAEEALSSLPKESLDDWFYVPGWRHSIPQLPPLKNVQPLKEEHWLIFADDCGVGDAVKAQLLAYRQHVTMVTPGTLFSRSLAGTYTIDPCSRSDYEHLFKDLRTRMIFPERIVHMWSLTTATLATRDLLDLGFHCLLTITQVLGEMQPASCQLSIISNEIYNVTGSEHIDPIKATVVGPCRVIPLEYPTLRSRCIDLALTNQEQSNASFVRLLVGELLADTTDALVALRGNHRWLQSYEPLHLTEDYEKAVPLREKGTYLITGGLGGVGLALAQHLAEQVQARLVLISRTALPLREEWPAIIARQEEHEPVSRQIRQILQIEEYGSEVLILPADVTDEDQMRHVIQQTKEVFGTLHGVLHAAGVPGIGLMQLKTREQAESVMGPKIMGTLVLERLLQDIQLDFLVLFSSITSATGGGPGQVDYCAANAFLDAYAHQNYARHSVTIVIDWGEWQWNAWQQGLSGYDIDAQTFFKQHRQRFGIPFADGSKAFSRILACNLPQVVVSTQDFQAIVGLSSAFTAATMLQKARQGMKERPRHSRPALATSYVAPRNEMEEKVTAIWQEVLGISQIGLKDNFFELGGNSLVGIDLITCLKQELSIPEIPSYVLYEAPSVETMTQFLTQNKSTATIEDRLDRGEKRRENLRQRVHDSRSGRAR